MAGGNQLQMERHAVGPLDESSRGAAVKIWREEDTRSLVHIAPELVQRAMLALPEERRLLTEGELRKLLRPSPLDNQLRLSFWLEYERVQSRMLGKMETAMIVRGICSDDYFRQKYLANELRVAWLITPPTSYVAKLSEAVDFGMERMREIMALEIFDEKTGKLNVSLAKLIVQCTMLLDARKHGAVVQKIETSNKTMSVNVHGGAKEVAEAVELMNMQDLDKKLKYLEKRERLVELGTIAEDVVDKDVIDVTSAQVSAVVEGTGDHEEDAGEQGSSDSII